MKTYFSNINRINEEVEEFVIAKNKIEAPLIEEEKIDKKMSIREFLGFVDLSKSIFVYNDELNITIPFYMAYPSKDEVVVVYSLDQHIEKYTAIFKENLEKINYDLSSLTKLNELEIFEGATAKIPYYIINNDYYILKS